MYKILIADDEDIIRRGLAGMVAQHPKLEVAALAEDGEIALEKAEETRPDLMLVDINMPFVDGFDFIKSVKTLLPDAEIIIVTGYDDFAFARRALRLGVSDYLLKPIMEEPFFTVLDKAVERLDNREKSRKYLDWLTRQLEQHRPAMVNDFFRRWLRGGMDQLEVEDRMRYLGIQIPTPYWVTILHLRSDPAQDASLVDWEPELSGHEPQKRLVLTQDEYDKSLASVCDSGSADVQMVVLGCPHYTLEEIRDVARMLKGKRVAEDVSLQIWTDMTMQHLAEVNGYAQTIKEAGAHLLNSACPLVCARTAYDIVKTGFVADGAKQAHYVHTDLNEKNCKVFYGSTKRCVEAAIKGRWEA